MTKNNMKNRDELPQFFKEKGFTIGAEVGVYKGEFSELFCKAGFKHFAIDPWKAFDGQGRTQQRQERQDFIFEHTTRLLSPYPNCTIIRKTSMDALADFKDGSLDYVYLDGDHSFMPVAEDIFHWAKKVRKGGIVAGHDYDMTRVGATNTVIHVKPVVDAYCTVFGKELVVFGKDNSTKNNSYPSWYFVN
jgi:hypothetical protein